MISTNGITANFITRSKIVVIITQIKYPTGRKHMRQSFIRPPRSMEEEVLAIEGEMLRNHLPTRTHTLHTVVLSTLGVKPRPHSAILCLQKLPSCAERYSMIGTAEPQKRKEGDDVI